VGRPRRSVRSFGGNMNEKLEVKWPWSLIYIEYADELIAQIKEALPPEHELQKHELFPGIKWERRPIFIVDDDTTDQTIFMNFEKMRRWKKTKYKVPTMRVFKNVAEVAQMIERDHVAECAKYNPDGTRK
jgi:hypothetical protein